MSAALPNPPTPDDVPVNFRDIGVGIAIGSLSWLIRYFCSMEKATPSYIMRRTVAAGLTSLLVGMATKGYFSSEGMAFAAAGAAGYCSPEAVDLLLVTLRKRAGKGRTATKE